MRSKPRSSSVLDTPQGIPPPLPKAPIPSRKKSSRRGNDQQYENTSISPDLTKKSLPKVPSIVRSPGQPCSVTSSTSSDVFASPSGDNPVLNLSTFIVKHSNDLPLRVRVEEGYCGRVERDVISSGDVYNFHFVKNEKVITIQDQGGNPYFIPLNSSVQFGLLYNPNSNLNEALKGFTFQSVPEIIAQKSPPQVLCVVDGHQGSHPKSSVEENEKLIVKKVGKTTMKRKPFVKVFSLKTKEEKTLYDDCSSHFTTDPYSVRLYLPDILEHFGDSLPLKATLYADLDTSSQDEPFHLSSDIVTLTHVSIESSIIASTCWEDDDHNSLSPIKASKPAEEDCRPIGIPVSLDIEVVVLPDESEDEQLYANTRALFETFDPQKVKTCGEEENGSGRGNSRLFSSIRKGFEKHGFEIQKPARIYEIPLEIPLVITPSVPPMEAIERPSPAASPKPPKKASHLPRDDAPLHRIFASKEKPLSNGSTSDVGSEISKLKASMKAIKSLVDSAQEHTQKQVNSLRAELAGVKQTVEGLNRNYKQLSADVYRLKQQFAVGGHSTDPSSLAHSPSSSHANTEQEEVNRRDFATFDHIKVLKLLEMMNMAQYQDSFMEEQVDGELLIECDEDVLMHELKVTSKLHRTKLMKLITGRHCASTVLLGLDPYVVLQRNES